MLTKFNPNSPEFWKDFDPFAIDESWDGSKTQRKSSRYSRAVWLQIYKLFFVEFKSQLEILELNPEWHRTAVYKLCKLENINFDEIKLLTGYSKEEHLANVNARLEYEQQRDLTDKRVYVLRSPGKDLLPWYDWYISNVAQAGKAAMKKFNKKIAPSDVYHLRYETLYDIDYINRYIGKKYEAKMEPGDAGRIWKMYPWLTNQNHYYMVFETLTELRDVTQVDVGSCLDGKFIATGPLMGWSIVYEKGTKLKEGAMKSIDEIFSKLQQDVDYERTKSAFLKKYGSVKLTNWTETFFKVEKPNGVTKLFKQKQEVLQYISKNLVKLGLVVKADRITQIFKDGCVMISVPAGPDSGKGAKTKIDAMPGWKFTVVYESNGYAINDKPCYKVNKTIQHGINQGWITAPTAITKKER